MGEVQLARIERLVQIASSDYFVNCNAHERVVFTRTPVIEVLSPARQGGGRERKESN